MRASYTPIIKNGKVHKVIKFASDVTEQVAKQANFESQLQAIHRAQAVIEFDLDGKILFANPNFLSLMGYSLKEVTGSIIVFLLIHKRLLQAVTVTFGDV